MFSTFRGSCPLERLVVILFIVLEIYGWKESYVMVVKWMYEVILLTNVEPLGILTEQTQEERNLFDLGESRRRTRSIREQDQRMDEGTLLLLTACDLTQISKERERRNRVAPKTLSFWRHIKVVLSLHAECACMSLFCVYCEYVSVFTLLFLYVISFLRVCTFFAAMMIIKIHRCLISVLFIRWSSALFSVLYVDITVPSEAMFIF